jgi:hypothetical protein
LVVGTSVIQHVRRGGRGAPWIVDLLKRKPPKLAAVALANKAARVALEADGQWSMLLCEIGTHGVGACRIAISQTRGAIQLQPC